MVFTDKNSNTKRDTDHANVIGWIFVVLAMQINKKDNIKPNCKLQLSPRNILGNPNNEKLKNKYMNTGSIKIMINSDKFSSLLIKKSNVKKVDIKVEDKTPSTPSKQLAALIIKNIQASVKGIEKFPRDVLNKS